MFFCIIFETEVLMNIYSDLNINDKDDFLHSIFPYTGSSKSDLLQTPYRLQIINYYPASEPYTFTIASISPDSTTYISLEKNDIQSHMSNLAHQHDFYEFIFVLHGELCQNIDGKNHYYTKGDVCILNKHIRHSFDFNANQDFRVVQLQLSVWLVESLYADLTMKMFQIERDNMSAPLFHFLDTNLHANKNAGKNYLDLRPQLDISFIAEYIYHSLDAITKETLSPQAGSSYTIKRMLSELLLALSSPIIYKTTPVIVDNSSEHLLFGQITQILEDTCGRATRKDLEEALHYSGTYLNNITKKCSGMTIFHYSMTFRMKEAVRLLLKTDLNITDITTELGFSNRTHFYRAFHELYGMTPKEFRNSYKI